MAPSPTVTGATSAVSEPMKARASDRGSMLVVAVVIAGDGAGADIGCLADIGIAEIGQVVCLGTVRQASSPSPRRSCRHARVRRVRRRGAAARAVRRCNAGRWCSRPDAEGVDLRACPTLTPGPNTTFGSIVTSGASSVSADRNTEPGSIMVTPASIAASRSQDCTTASAAASSLRELMPASSSAGASTAATRPPSARASATTSVR